MVKEDNALLNAVELGDLDGVLKALDAGADIHAWDDEALQWASEEGHLEVVRLLLDRGAGIHAGEDGALRRASVEGHLEIVRLLEGHILQEARKKKIGILTC